MLPRPRSIQVREQWRSRRKPLTLVASFRCVNGIVMCADAEENCGSVRRSVLKLDPKPMGNFTVVIGGSGPGDLIDAFIIRLTERLAGDAAESLADFRAITESELAGFYAADVATYPDEEKRIKCIVTAYAKKSGTFHSWVTKHTVLSPVSTYELAGIEDALYDNVVKRFFRADMTLAQGALCGCYLFAVAKETSTYIRGDTSLVIITGDGVFSESSQYVRMIDDRLKDYERGVNQIFLSCADTSVSPARLERELQGFSHDAIELHKSHMEAIVTTHMSGALDNDALVPRFGRLPQYIIAVPKGTVVNEELIAEIRRELAQVHKLPDAVATAFNHFIIMGEGGSGEITQSDAQTSEDQQ